MPNKLYEQQTTEYLEWFRDRMIEEWKIDFWIMDKINFILSNRKWKKIEDKDRPCKGACWGGCWIYCKNLS